MIMMTNVLLSPVLPSTKAAQVPDTDGDGLNDEVDKCPTAKGTIARNGCPEEVKERDRGESELCGPSYTVPAKQVQSYAVIICGTG